MFGPDGAAASAGGDPFGFGGGGGGIGDIFDAFFAGGGGGFGRSGFGGQPGPPRGSDLEIVADIDFETAVFGGEDGIPADDEARAIWREVTGFGDERIFGLGKNPPSQVVANVAWRDGAGVAHHASFKLRPGWHAVLLEER